MAMLRWVLAIFCLALALPAGGALALPCQVQDVEPMPCCEQGMADCAESGMTADCCSLVPGGSAERLLVTSPSAQVEASRLCWSVAPVVLGSTLPTLATSGQTYPAHSPGRSPHVPPFVARTTVLLI